MKYSVLLLFFIYSCLLVQAREALRPGEKLDGRWLHGFYQLGFPDRTGAEAWKRRNPELTVEFVEADDGSVIARTPISVDLLQYTPWGAKADEEELEDGVYDIGRTGTGTPYEKREEALAIIKKGIDNKEWTSGIWYASEYRNVRLLHLTEGSRAGWWMIVSDCYVDLVAVAHRKLDEQAARLRYFISSPGDGWSAKQRIGPIHQVLYGGNPQGHVLGMYSAGDTWVCTYQPHGVVNVYTFTREITARHLNSMLSFYTYFGSTPEKRSMGEHGYVWVGEDSRQWQYVWQTDAHTFIHLKVGKDRLLFAKDKTPLLAAYIEEYPSIWPTAADTFDRERWAAMHGEAMLEWLQHFVDLEDMHRGNPEAEFGFANGLWRFSVWYKLPIVLTPAEVEDYEQHLKKARREELMAVLRTWWQANDGRPPLRPNAPDMDVPEWKE